MNKPKLPDSSTSVLNIYTDGGARGNPGPAAVGVVIKDKGQNTIHQFSRFIGIATNNVAEYQAVIAGLQWLLSQPEKYQRLKFFLDSALVVNQLNGQWKIKSAHLRQLLIVVRQLEAQLKCPISYTAVPRSQNSAPDSLLNQALDRVSV